MNECDWLDRLITPYVDGELERADAQRVAFHLGECAMCRTRVDTETTVRQTLRTQAAASRALGVEPSWRPRTFRLGRPPLVTPRRALLTAAAAAAVVAVVIGLPPAPALAVGIIGDSNCGEAHRYTTPGGPDDRACTLGCVARGAEFVLVTEDGVYRIANQSFPRLASYANVPVTISGRLEGQRVTIAEIQATGS
jgi:hypothetical protein